MSLAVTIQIEQKCMGKLPTYSRSIIQIDLLLCSPAGAKLRGCTNTQFAFQICNFFFYPDVNECEENHSCSDKCINTNGSFVCICKPGFWLERDQQTQCIGRSILPLNLWHWPGLLYMKSVCQGFRKCI